MVHVNNDWVPRVLVLVIMCYSFFGGEVYAMLSPRTLGGLRARLACKRLREATIQGAQGYNPV